LVNHINPKMILQTVRESHDYNYSK
jgi:hypothetical protein